MSFVATTWKFLAKLVIGSCIIIILPILLVPGLLFYYIHGSIYALGAVIGYMLIWSLLEPELYELAKDCLHQLHLL